MSLASDMNRNLDDPSDVDPEGAFSGGGKGPYIPPGEWRLGIKPDYSEYTDTSTGGKMVKLDLKVLTEAQEGRRIFENFNIVNKNQDVAERDSEKLQAIWIACGGDPNRVPELDELFGKTFIAETGLEWDDYKEGDYKPVLKGARAESEGPAAGRKPDDEMPDIWEEAVEYARNKGDGGGGGNSGPAPSGGGGGSVGGNTDSFDDSEIPFRDDPDAFNQPWETIV